MKIINVNQDKTSVSFVVEVDSKVWQTKLDESLTNIGKKVKIEGFRPGKAPKAELKKRVNQLEVFNNALNNVSRQVVQFVEESKELDKITEELWVRPSMDVEDISETKLVVKLIYDIIPEIKLGNYKKLALDLPEQKNVTDDEVNQDVQRIVNWNKKYVDVKNTPVANGHNAIIDFKGYIDEKPFSGGEGHDYSLKIGSKSFIDNFEDQLIGMNIGDTKDVMVSFPQDYHAKEFAGKPAKFVVTIKNIQQEEAQELSDEFVKSLNYKDVNTIQELKDYVKKQLENRNQSVLRNQLQNDVVKAVIDVTKIESTLPSSLVDDEKNKLFQQLHNQLNKQKKTFEQYLKDNKFSEKQFDEMLTKDAFNSIKYALAVQKIAKDNDIVISEEDTKAYLQNVAKLYNIPYEALLSQVGGNVEFIQQTLLNDKVIDFIIEQNYHNKKSTKK